MSECRSFGSNYYPSSQSRKVSIGVMADCLPGRKPGSTKGDENALPRVEKLNSATGNDLDANKKHEKISAPNGRNATRAPEHVSSPWRTPKPSHRKLGTLDDVLCRQTSSLSGSKGLQKAVNGVKQGPAMESLQQFVTSNLQSRADNLNFGERSQGNDGSLERVEEFTSAAAQEKIVSGGLVEDKVDKAENRGTEVLRTKLWEILGTVSSPQSHHSDTKAPEVRDNGSNQDQNKGSKNNKFAKPRINSDTVETDSESPENATRRPVTRSLLRKKAPTRAAQKTRNSGAHSSHKHEEQEKTIFSFQEGLLGKACATPNVSSPPKNKKTRRKTAALQCRKFQSSKKDGANEIQKETHKTVPPAQNVQTENTFSTSYKLGSVDDFPQNQLGFQKPRNDIREEDVLQSQATKTANKPGSFHRLSESLGKLGEEINPSKKKAVEPQDDLCSPTFGFRTPTSSPSPCFSPETTPMHPSDNSPEPEETETPVFSFGTKKASQAPCDGSNAERELPDASEKSRDYSFRKGTPAKLNEDSEGLSESSSDERDSKGSGEDSPLTEHYNCYRGKGTSPQGSHTKPKFLFPSAKRKCSSMGTRLYEPSPPLSSPKGHRRRETSPQGSYKKSKFVFLSAKRNSSPKGTRIYEPSPTLSAPKELHKTNCFLGSSGMNEDDGLGRAVTLFAVALQNFEKKLKSAARKKSTEILASVSEEINLQMKNAESHILTEVGKLSNTTKTKRKHAEMRFQEHQEQLRLVHEKFKDDLGHHLEDFKSTLEDLEANQTELKGAIKKQKASNQQLITRLEGEVETQLVNAERRINAVNESARGKMLQLKRIVVECLKDDILR